jgi:hypothetical protein
MHDEISIGNNPIINQSVPSMNQEEYMKERVEDQITWYNNKSKHNQRIFKRLRIIEIIAAALVPVLAGFVSKFDRLEYVIALLGIVVVVVAGILSLYRFQEIWTEYRTTCESLKHEKFLFLTGAEPYNVAEPFGLFVNRVESLISKENTQWKLYMKNEQKPAEKET